MTAWDRSGTLVMTTSSLIRRMVHSDSATSCLCYKLLVLQAEKAVLGDRLNPNPASTGR
jgi:hypothetical protein